MGRLHAHLCTLLVLSPSLATLRANSNHALAHGPLQGLTSSALLAIRHPREIATTCVPRIGLSPVGIMAIADLT